MTTEKKHVCGDCDGKGFTNFPNFPGICTTCKGIGYFLDEDLEQEIFDIDTMLKGISYEIHEFDLDIFCKESEL